MNERSYPQWQLKQLEVEDDGPESVIYTDWEDDLGSEVYNVISRVIPHLHVY
jgi:hypothetical protein